MTRVTTLSKFQKTIKSNQNLLNANFVGKGKSMAKWGFSTEREAAISESLQDIMRQAVPNIAETLHP